MSVTIVSTCWLAFASISNEVFRSSLACEWFLLHLTSLYIHIFPIPLAFSSIVEISISSYNKSYNYEQFPARALFVPRVSALLE